MPCAREELLSALAPVTGQTPSLADVICDTEVTVDGAFRSLLDANYPSIIDVA
jgi:hypothetical protein